MSLGNFKNKKPVLRYQYEAETLSVRRVCFDEELEIFNTYEESRKIKMLLNDADVVNLEQCIQRLIAYSAVKIKLSNDLNYSA